MGGEFDINLGVGGIHANKIADANGQGQTWGGSFASPYGGSINVGKGNNGGPWSADAAFTVGPAAEVHYGPVQNNVTTLSEIIENIYVPDDYIYMGP